MRFSSPLLEGRLLRRYKRFLADVELSGIGVVTAHCANPGSMRTCMVEGGRVWLSRSDNPKRKLAYTWELAEVGDALVCVNTARANDVVAEALAAGVITELVGYRHIEREVRYGEHSRIDFALRDGSDTCFVEVKSVTLHGGGTLAAFPDSVSARGSKHLRDLMRAVTEGHRAVLLFCCNRTGVSAVRPADEVDPRYGYTLRQARARGVELLCYRTQMNEHGLSLTERLPVQLPPFDYTPPPPRTARRGAVKLGAKKKVVLRNR